MTEKNLTLAYHRAPLVKPSISRSQNWIAFWLLLPWILIFAWYAFVLSVGC